VSSLTSSPASFPPHSYACRLDKYELKQYPEQAAVLSLEDLLNAAMGSVTGPGAAATAAAGVALGGVVGAGVGA